MKNHVLSRTDALAWADAQSSALRQRAVSAIDWDQVADEIADIAHAHRRLADDQVIAILVNFMRIAATSEPGPVKHWRREIAAQRIELDRLATPSLSAAMPGRMQQVYAFARRRYMLDHPPAAEAPPPPAASPYAWEDVCGRGEDWTPAPLPPT
jgi:hypothetical protein